MLSSVIRSTRGRRHTPDPRGNRHSLPRNYNHKISADIVVSSLLRKKINTVLEFLIEIIMVGSRSYSKNKIMYQTDLVCVPMYFISVHK